MKRPARGARLTAELVQGTGMRPTHVIFDLDGTLLDSEILYTRAAERVCSRYGATYTLALKRSIMGGDSHAGARAVVRTLGLPLTPERYLEEREAELLALLPELAPMPHARELVAALELHGVPLAIATSGHRGITAAKLSHHAFLSNIDVRICGDDPRLERGKPAPDIYLLAARELGAEPASCLAIEDSVLGVQAAVSAGMTTVALVDRRYGFTAEQFAGATRIIHSLAELDVSLLSRSA